MYTVYNDSLYAFYFFHYDFPPLFLCSLILYCGNFSEKKKGSSFAGRIKKKFTRSKKRSQSADRAGGSLREGSNYLQPPEGSTSPRSKGLFLVSVVTFVTLF